MPGDDRLQMFDHYLHNLEELVSGGRVAPAWAPDGATLGYVDGRPDERRAWRVDLTTGERMALFDVEKARGAIRDATGEVPPGRGVPFSEFKWTGHDEIGFEMSGAGFLLNLSSSDVRKLENASPVDKLHGLSDRERKTPKEYLRSTRLGGAVPALEVPSPDRAYLLSTDNSNIVARSTYDGRVVRLTEDGRPESEWRFDAPSLTAPGSAAPRPSACWSPDSRKVAAYKVDLRGVYQAPQVHYLKSQDEVVYNYGAKAGGTMERTNLYVLDLLGRPPVALDLGDTSDSYPVAVAWLPGSTSVVVFRMSRDCKRAEVLLADAATGAVTPVFTETAESFVRTQHSVYNQVSMPQVGLWLTPDGQQIIWQSERSGWRHFYLYDLDGNLVRQLTDGPWPVEDLVAIRDGYLYFSGHRDQDRPYDLHFYRVPLEGGEVQALTEAPGAHDVALAPSGLAFLDTYSTCSRPAVVELRTTGGNRLAELSRGDISKLESVGFIPPEQFTTLAADGKTQLWGVMFKPHDFQPGRRYPLIEYIYGGPQTVAVPHSFLDGRLSQSFATMAQAVAQLGYITVMVDARGTPGRSKSFHDSSYMWFANVLADDHAEAILQLAARYDFIDGDHIGIIGQSWGGYSAFRCFVDRPDVYKAAVCSEPAFDPYASLLYECYLDMPQTNPAGYAFADCIQRAAKVEGPLLMAVGTSDLLCWTDTVKMVEALIRADKHEFVLLPEQYHGYFYDTQHDSYFWKGVVEFFASHIGSVPDKDGGIK